MTLPTPAHGMRLLLLVMISVSGCSLLDQLDYRPLDVKGTALRLERLGLTEAAFTLDAEVENTNPFTLPINAMDYSLSVGDVALIDRADHEGSSLGAGETSTLEIPVTIAYADVADLVVSLARGAKTVPYSGEIGLSLRRLGVDRRLPIPFQGEIPVPKPPVVRIEDFDWNFSLTEGLSGSLTLDAAEEADRLGRISDLTCDLLFNGESLVDLGDPVDLDGGRVRIPWSVDGLGAANSLRRVLGGEGMEVGVDGEMIFAAPWGPVSVPLNLQLIR